MNAPTSDRSRAVESAIATLARVLRREWPLIGIGLAGLALRSHQLLAQVPIDDEWHALSQSMTQRTGHILTHFCESDVSIPLAVYYKALILTIGLTSWGLRLPFLLFGVATVVVFPLMVRPVVGRLTANVFAALLSASPILIFFSRFARPYAIALFCAFGASMAFRTWWDHGGRRWASAYVALAAFACWLSLVFAPFVLGSFLLYLPAAVGSSAPKRAALRRWVRLGFVTLLVLAILIVPPLWFDAASLLLKAKGPAILPSYLYNTAVHALGNGQAALAIGLALLAAIGMVVLLFREPRFTGHLAGLAALQVVGFVAARPVLSNQVNVSSRYLLPVLAVTLLFASVGIVAVCGGLDRAVASWVRPALAVAVCGAMLWWSPVPMIVARPNSWASHYLATTRSWYDRFYARNVRPVPPFYETLALKPPGSAPIVEVPSNALTFSSPLPFYQRIHRQPILIGMHNGAFGPPAPGEVPYGHAGIRLGTNVFVSDIASMRQRGARFVIVHRDLYGETRSPPAWVAPSADMQSCIEWLGTQLGPPVFEDRAIVVFRLSPDDARTGSP